MIRIVIVFLCCTIWLGAKAQPQPTYNRFDTTAESEKYWTAWLKDLYELGVVMDKDSIKINDEAKKIILDTNFRKAVYPPSYTWEGAIYLLKIMELKKGFWYLINLYAADTANRKMVIETLVPFDKLMDMEKVMTSTFYTYALLDPKICTISNGKPVITRPDIVEREFAQLKEIISYIEYYRKQQKGG
jgi:hypothetical protein